MNELFLSEDLWQTFIIEENFQRRRMPYADLKRNFIVGPEIKGSLLEMYKNPCRLKAGIFVLCLQGELKAAIHGNLWEIRKNDFIGIMPGSVIQYYQQSADLRICFVAFSSSVMESINFQQLTIDFVSVMQENPERVLRAGRSSRGCCRMCPRNVTGWHLFWCLSCHVLEGMRRMF